MWMPIRRRSFIKDINLLYSLLSLSFIWLGLCVNPLNLIMIKYTSALQKKITVCNLLYNLFNTFCVPQMFSALYNHYSIPILMDKLGFWLNPSLELIMHRFLKMRFSRVKLIWLHLLQAVSSACAIAKHRKANNIEVEDVQVKNDDDPVGEVSVIHCD